MRMRWGFMGWPYHVTFRVSYLVYSPRIDSPDRNRSCPLLDHKNMQSCSSCSQMIASFCTLGTRQSKAQFSTVAVSQATVCTVAYREALRRTGRGWSRLVDWPLDCTIFSLLYLDLFSKLARSACLNKIFTWIVARRSIKTILQVVVL